MTRPILLVEDNENDVFFFNRAIQKEGLLHPVHHVEDGREAMKYLLGNGQYADRAKFPLPALVLLDLKLPHVPGLELLRWIREQPQIQRLVVVILTSSPHEFDVESAYRLGANSFLVKPSSADELAAMVRLICNYWLELNQPPVLGSTTRSATTLLPNSNP